MGRGADRRADITWTKAGDVWLLPEGLWPAVARRARRLRLAAPALPLPTRTEAPE